MGYHFRKKGEWRNRKEMLLIFCKRKRQRESDMGFLLSLMQLEANLINIWSYRYLSLEAESIDLSIEDQTFSPSYDLAPPPPPSPVNKPSRRHKGRLRKRQLADGRGRSQIIRPKESQSSMNIQYSLCRSKGWLIVRIFPAGLGTNGGNWGGGGANASLD